MALYIPLTLENGDILQAVNGGIVPLLETDENGAPLPTYLVVDGGEINRLVTREDMPLEVKMQPFELRGYLSV